MTYGYARCSTNESKQDIDRQTRELLDMGATDQTLFMEFEHGDTENKRELNKLLTIMRPGDALVTTEVSRLARSTKQLCEIIDFIEAHRLKLIIKGSAFTIDCTAGELDPMTRAFLEMAGVFSALELGMIRARVKSGVANARAKGKRLGRPPVDADTLNPTFKKYYPQYKAGLMNVSLLARAAGISRPTCYRWIELAEAYTPAAKRSAGK